MRFCLIYFLELARLSTFIGFFKILMQLFDIIGCCIVGLFFLLSLICFTDIYRYFRLLCFISSFVSTASPRKFYCVNLVGPLFALIQFNSFITSNQVDDATIDQFREFMWILHPAVSTVCSISAQIMPPNFCKTSFLFAFIVHLIISRKVV